MWFLRVEVRHAHQHVSGCKERIREEKKRKQTPKTCICMSWGCKERNKKKKEKKPWKHMYVCPGVAKWVTCMVGVEHAWWRLRMHDGVKNAWWGSDIHSGG